MRPRQPHELCDPAALQTFTAAWLSSMTSAFGGFHADVPTAAAQAIAPCVLPHPPRQSLPRGHCQRWRSDVSSCSSVGLDVAHEVEALYVLLIGPLSNA
eukprot:6353439-Pyramimonas_sp.AAC.2